MFRIKHDNTYLISFNIIFFPSNVREWECANSNSYILISKAWRLLIWELFLNITNIRNYDNILKQHMSVFHWDSNLNPTFIMFTSLKITVIMFVTNWHDGSNSTWTTLTHLNQNSNVGSVWSQHPGYSHLPVKTHL